MAVSDEELIGRARELVPVIRARTQGTEEGRRVNDDTIRELAEAGIIQMLVPKRWGGSEARLDTMRQVVETLSSACVSTGWIASFYIEHNVYVARFSEKAQAELYGPRGYVLMPTATAPDMKAKKVEGGWIVSGRAAWGSGIMHADWAQISGWTGEGIRSFIVPVADVTVIDTWNYSGAAGTGSNDYAVNEVFVPDHRTLDMLEFQSGATEAARAYENPLYRVPFLLLAYCTIVPVATGGLVGAMAEYRGMVSQRVRNFSGVVVKDLQHAHVMLGEMEIRTRIATDLAEGVYSKVSDLMASDLTVGDRIHMKGRVAFLADHCRQTVNAMMSNAGASSFHHSQPLQRFWRDLNMICSHAFWDWDSSREVVGRHLLDLPVKNPLV